MKTKCKVCGAEYEYCYSCEKVNSWRVHTDTAEHYYILCVLMEYRTDHDAKKAYRALRKRGIDLRSTDGYQPNVKRLLDEIYSLQHNGSKVKESPVVEAIPVVLEEIAQVLTESTEEAGDEK